MDMNGHIGINGARVKICRQTQVGEFLNPLSVACFLWHRTRASAGVKIVSTYFSRSSFALISFNRIEHPGEQTPRSPLK